MMVTKVHSMMAMELDPIIKTQSHPMKATTNHPKRATKVHPMRATQIHPKMAMKKSINNRNGIPSNDSTEIHPVMVTSQSTTVTESHPVTVTEEVAFTKFEVIIDSELPWAANKNVHMKEGLDVVGTTPDDSGFESDLEWPRSTERRSRRIRNFIK